MNFYIKTFGCQMNVNDSEKIRHLLKEKGLVCVEKETEADIVVINSCAVRQKPQEKIYSFMGSLSSGQRVILAGCVAQLERDRLFSRKKKPDFVVGTNQFYRIGEIIDQLETRKKPGIALGFTRQWHELIPAPQARSSSFSAYVSIMEGCDNFCSYCVVPFTRGREKHRPYKYIMAEIENLLRLNYREIVLLGQNVNAWRDEKEKMGFPILLDRIAGSANSCWIRFITSYPGYHDPRIIDVFRDHRVLARHIHFPAQSGSTRVLRRMNRGYSRTQYLRFIREFRREIPEMAFSSDFIVGFPGESERDFESTVSLLRQVRFESIFSFIYSPRPNSRAFRFLDRHPLETKKRRLYELHRVQEEIQQMQNRTLIGKELSVLITERHPRKSNEAIGRTETNRVVNFISIKAPGVFCRVKIFSAGPHSLQGEETIA